MKLVKSVIQFHKKSENRKKKWKWSGIVKNPDFKWQIVYHSKFWSVKKTKSKNKNQIFTKKKQFYGWFFYHTFPVSSKWNWKKRNFSNTQNHLCNRVLWFTASNFKITIFQQLSLFFFMKLSIKVKTKYETIHKSEEKKLWNCLGNHDECQKNYPTSVSPRHEIFVPFYVKK